jgi:hypothetical protein
MALYALALGYSNGIAPLIMGFINDGQGYQWVFVSHWSQFHQVYHQY